MLRQFLSTAVTAVFSAIFLVAFAQTAGGAPYELATQVGANLGCIVGNSGPGLCNPAGNGDHDADFYIPGPNNGAGYVSVTNLTDPSGDTHFTYSAEANASFGKLQAGASGMYDLTSASTRAAFAAAFVTDQLTLTAPGQTGSGTLEISVQLDGVLQSTGGGGGALFAAVGWGPDSDVLNSPLTTAKIVQQATSGTHAGLQPPLVLSVPFVWGEQFYLGLILGVGAGTPVTSLIDCFGGDACLTPVSGTGSGTADFFHTMTLTGLVPMDAQGNRVLGTQFSSGSGAVYATNGIVSQPVPEPGSLLLIGTGLAGLTYRRRRRR